MLFIRIKASSASCLASSLAKTNTVQTNVAKEVQGRWWAEMQSAPLLMAAWLHLYQVQRNTQNRIIKANRLTHASVSLDSIAVVAAKWSLAWCFHSDCSITYSIFTWRSSSGCTLQTVRRGVHIHATLVDLQSCAIELCLVAASKFSHLDQSLATFCELNWCAQGQAAVWTLQWWARFTLWLPWNSFIDP